MLLVTAVAPVPRHPQEEAAEHQASVWVVFVIWGNEVTPSCTWKYLKNQIGCVAETVVLVVCHDCCLVVESDSTSELLWSFLSLVQSLVQCELSTNPKGCAFNLLGTSSTPLQQVAAAFFQKGLALRSVKKSLGMKLQ